MSKLIKILLTTLFVIIAVPILAIGAVMLLIDPNDYKSDIESLAAQNSNAILKIDGDLGWSLIPLGININQVNVKTADQKPFTELKQLTAEVDLFSLFKMEPKVHRLVLNGLTTYLSKNKDGEANWATLTKPSTPEAENTTPAPKASEADNSKEAEKPEDIAKRPLSFDVAEVAITNTTVHYSDAQSGQAVALQGFDLIASHITLDKAFPLHIKFAVSNTSPQVDLKADLKTQILIASDFKRFQLSDVKLASSIKGEPTQQKNIDISLATNATVDLNKDTASIDNLVLKAASLQLASHLNVAKLTQTPTFNGNLQIQEFSLQKLLQELGQEAITTADKSVLSKLALSLDLSGQPEAIQLTNLMIALDDTKFTGNGQFASQPLTAKLKLDGSAIDVDRYLPPPPTKAEQAASALNQQTTGNKQDTPKAKNSNTQETPLLPVELLRDLVLDIHIRQQQVKVKNLKVNDIQLDVTADKGLLKLEQISAKLYEGYIKAVASIDARNGSTTGEGVLWNIHKEVKNIQTLPLLTDFGEITMLSGGINANVDLKTKGNLISTLRNAAKGSADFSFDKGAFHGFNMTALACQGVAMINRESANTSSWPNATPFTDLSGRLLIDGNTLNNERLVASLSGLALSGNGVIDLLQQNVDYKVALNVVGDLGDNACRVQERVKNVPIPVRCKGSLTAPPAELCGLDTERLSDVIEAMAKAEVKRKAKKEVDKQLDKLIKDDIPAKQEIKKLFKGLF